MAHQLLHDFATTSGPLALMAAAYYYASSAMQIPSGLLIDRYGPRRMLTLGAFLMTIGTLIFASAHSLPFASMGRMLQGLGGAFAFISSLKLVTTWFKPAQFALLAGSTNVIGYIGATSGGAPLHFFIQHYGWRHSLISLSFFSLLLGIIFWLIVRDKKSKKISPMKRQQRHLLHGLFDIAKKPQSWFNALFTGLMVGPTSTFAALWGVSFLVNAGKLNFSIAAGAVSMIFVGVACGSPLYGFISDHLKLRKPPLIIAAAGALITTTLIIFFPTVSTPLLYGLCFLFGFFQSSHALNFAIALEVNRPAISGVAIAFTNMILILCCAIMQPLTGFLMQWHSHNRTIHGVAHYTAADYHFGLLILPIAQAFALLIAILFLKETHGKPGHHFVPEESCAQL